MTTTEEREPIAVTKRLWRITVERHSAEAEELSRMAVAAEGLSYSDGWRFDVMRGLLVRIVLGAPDE